MVNIGELNKRIELYKITQTTDDDGYPIPEEILIHSCYAKFSRMSGSEIAKSNGDYGVVRARFLIRYTKKSLSRKMIVKYGGNNYEIEYLNDYNDSHEFIEIVCKLVSISEVS